MGNLEYSITVAPQDDLPTEVRVQSLVESVFKGENILWDTIGIILSDHEAVLDLNKEWLEHDYTTDVISFLLEADPLSLEGEVYVDVETARERCEEFGTTTSLEIERYIVHGLLHLAGYDDTSDQERAHMRKLEDHYLAG